MTASSYNKSVGDLNDTIDKLIDRLSSIEPSSLEQLEQWRETSYRSIDDYCKHKRHELIEKKQIQQQKQLDHLRTQVNQLIDRHDNKKEHYDIINHDLQLSEIKINELEHLRLTLHPLSIDEHLIVRRRRIFPLSHSYRTIHLKAGLESAIGTNDQHLLVDREGKHLCLLDQNLTIIKEIPFTHDGIHGICWSSTIHRFIIITFKEILLLDEKTMSLEICPIPSKKDWWRGTCSNQSLFLSTVEWEWHTPITCGKDEIICDLKYNNGYLAIPIYNKHKDESRFELRSITTFDNIWSVRTHGRCRCCSIDIDQWLVMDHDDCRFFHISADGKLLETDKYDEHERLEDIIPWNNDDIVVLTKKNIHLHKFG
ncbi:unnamed protein product [Adineta steineri]|uniref:Uncharacterized protein n=1 Tax=Adineta steineri TaxID=433720 RepID=A0A816D0U7_9BILA|nr:unnamed protein product [Adineta steineri]CAF1630241.1 unnamed protein product [Adineta steineri]